MIALDAHYGKFSRFNEWCEICDRFRETTRDARERIRCGEFPPSALIYVAIRHPGCRRTWFVGQAIDPRAKRRSSSERGRWSRAIWFLRWLHRPGRSFRSAMRRVHKRYPSTSRKPGFAAAARHAWHREKQLLREPLRYPQRRKASTRPQTTRDKTAAT